MKFRLHPILLPVFLFFIVTGNISMYAIVFLSLLIHEAGHMVAAWTSGMRIRSCTIMPYGGELVIPGKRTASKKERIRVALGGPVATSVVLCAALLFSFPEDELVVRVQLALLVLNLLPVLPLDGGQVLSAILEKKGIEYSARTAMLVFSMVVLGASSLLFGLYLPATTPFLFLTLFLFFQNIGSFRFRKYEKAFVKLKHKQVDET